MKKSFLILMACSFPLVLRANLPRDPVEYAAWEQSLLSGIEQRKNSPPEIAIPKLGDLVSRLSQGANIEGGERPVFHAAQTALLAIPGHAKYYQDKIEAIREQVKANAKLSAEEKKQLRKAGKPAAEFGDYLDVRREVFEVLAQMPSPEAVAVLGHFLEDPEGRDGKNLFGNPFVFHDDSAPPLPNCALACIAITHLGIEHAPISDVNTLNYVVMDPQQVDLWKNWWGEVKSGKRTYRFKGSAIEYGADGPATKEQLDKREKDRKRTEEGRKGKNGALESPADSGRSSNIPHVALILAGSTVLGSLVWYFRRAAR